MLEIYDLDQKTTASVVEEQIKIIPFLLLFGEKGFLKIWLNCSLGPRNTLRQRPLWHQGRQIKMKVAKEGAKKKKED